MKTFAAIIRNARKAKGYSQGQLSQMTSITKGYVSHIERDRTSYPPSEEVILLLAMCLDLDPQSLTYSAGRILPEDQEIIESLAQIYGKDFPELLRRIAANPDQVRQIFQLKEVE